MLYRKSAFTILLVVMLSAAATVLAADTRPEPTAVTDKPDIVIILSDQFNPRCTGYAGDADALTPHLDTMAQKGVVFEQCYTPAPICMPARCALISGLYPHNHHLWTNNSDFYMPPEWAPMFRDLQAAGYTTAQIGKLHWFGGHRWEDRYEKLDEFFADLGLDHCEDISTPFTTPTGHSSYQTYLRTLNLLNPYCRDMAVRMADGEYIPRASVVAPQQHNDSYIARRGIDFIKKQPNDKPFCLVISLPGPHPPMDAPGEYATMFDPQKLHLPPNIPARFSYRRKSYDESKLRAMRANYYGKIALIDTCVGQIMEAIRKRGTEDRTLIAFTADHGEMMGAHGKLSKGRFYEESGRVPLVMAWPGRIPAGTRRGALVQMFDLYPALVEAAGGTMTDGRFARSLLPVARGQKDKIRDAVFSEVGHRAYHNYMVRTGRWKWFIDYEKEYLFDLEQDPWEMHNLISDEACADTLMDIRAIHLAHLRTTQFNVSHDYVPMLKRLGGWEEDTTGLSDRLYEKFKKAQGLD